MLTIACCALSVSLDKASYKCAMKKLLKSINVHVQWIIYTRDMFQHNVVSVPHKLHLFNGRVTTWNRGMGTWAYENMGLGLTRRRSFRVGFLDQPLVVVILVGIGCDLWIHQMTHHPENLNFSRGPIKILLFKNFVQLGCINVKGQICNFVRPVAVGTPRGPLGRGGCENGGVLLLLFCS